MKKCRKRKEHTTRCVDERSGWEVERWRYPTDLSSIVEQRCGRAHPLCKKLGKLCDAGWKRSQRDRGVS